MRSRVMVIGRDARSRARLARLVTSGGYRAEVAASVAHARRAGLKGIALAIIEPNEAGPQQTAAVEELRAAVGRVLVVGPFGRPGSSPDFIDPSDEAGLLARISQALAPEPEPEAAEPVLAFEGYRLDLAGHSLTNPAGKEILLRPAEFSLLRAFAQRAGRALSRDQLLQLVAGRDAEPYDRSVDMQILRLRRKIEPDPSAPASSSLCLAAATNSPCRCAKPDVLKLPRANRLRRIFTPPPKRQPRRASRSSCCLSRTLAGTPSRTISSTG